jgi:membrane protein CcdC involved in cytochrome C biogenesis
MIKPDSYYEKRQRAYVFYKYSLLKIRTILTVLVFIIMKSEDDAQGAIASIFWNTKTHWNRTIA